VGVGRQLADAVAGVPHMARAEFEGMLTDAAQARACPFPLCLAGGCSETDSSVPLHRNAVWKDR